ncbi:stemmadenine O-acetyltransferase-like [Rhododendron vialii]|uniref:stemmadenine O-acetyltransferase-like n=1 Tax=Rhododendron vialii TaxID=182163 RepID=UPI00265F783B|nr:stemmadenine O-acetyltransferase-like [Rhododendron vialii]
MVKVEIISKESIKPSSKTPDRLRTFRLSLLDQCSAPFMYFPLLLYYSHDKRTSNVKQAEISLLLKRSLSDALALYYPFAGRMKGESSVDCDDQGVDCLEARVDIRLSEVIESPEVQVINQFVPSTSEESDGVLLGIQLNFFTCGGMAIGISINHKIADVCTLSMFVKAWAAAARGDTNLVAPSFVASSLFPPKEQSGQEMILGSVEHWADASLFPPKEQSGQEMILGSVEQWADARRFCFSSSKIAALRAEVGDNTAFQPTRVKLVTAAIWKWAMTREGRDRSRLSVAGHGVNIRGRMDPPLSESTFGNVVMRSPNVSGNSEMGLGELVSKTSEAIGRIDSEYLKELQGENGYDMVTRGVKEGVELVLDEEVDYFRFTSWCRFPFSESDFGWGKPVWVSTAGCPEVSNTAVLLDSMSDVGGIEAWITMDGIDTCDEI